MLEDGARTRNMSAQTEVVCPLCPKRRLKRLGSHLKYTHHLKTVKERMPYMKQAISKHSPEKTLSNEMKNEHWLTYKKETRKAETEFKRMEEVFVNMRMLLMRDRPHSEILKEQLRIEVKEILMPLYYYLTKMLAQYAYDGECIASQEAHQQEIINSEVIGEPIPKKKKPNEEVTWNGLVKCNLCNFEWNGHAQHDCTYTRE